MPSSNLHARKRVSPPNDLGETLLSDTNEDSEGSKRFPWKEVACRVFRYGLLPVGALLLMTRFVVDKAAFERIATSSSRSFSKHPLFVTIVEPSEVDPKDAHERLAMIQATWGEAARAIFIVSNVTQQHPELSDRVIAFDGEDSQALSPDYPKLLHIPTDVASDVRSTAGFQHIVRTIMKRLDPDFVLFAVDHTYVLPENLCRYIQSRNPGELVYAGHALKLGNDGNFIQPGSGGYLLSRKTMQGLIQKWDDNDSVCTSTNTMFLPKCLSTSLHLKNVEDTRDADKRHRFHCFPLTRVVSGEVDEWYNRISYHPNGVGDDCCSDETISFHYVGAQETRALYDTRQALLDNPKMPNEELKRIMVEKWPKKGHEIGAYSRKLPDDSKQWGALLSVLRRITSRGGSC